MLFPRMAGKITPSFLNRLMAHFDSCKDVCDHFGIQTVLLPFQRGNVVVGFTVKSYRNPDKDLSGENADGYQFAYDPFWDDDDEDFNFEGIDEEIEGEDFLKSAKRFPDIVDKIPDNDDKIIDITKTWVSKMMSDMGICPFTSGAEMAGLPMGQVRYTIERCTSIEAMYARYWKEVVMVERQNERDLSTTLLIGPEFCIDHVELFENFSTTLTQPLTGLGLEDLLQLVFFHPHWTFRDGGNRQSEGGSAANYARRSPWPMINILRTNQVRAAQKGIPTGLVYQQNEKTLGRVGADELETMLRLRDWSGIEDVKVNRRDMEALRVAQDFQQSGTVTEEDTSFLYDSTPAANKVDTAQVDQGNLINVLQQALEKRLGQGGDGKVTQLSGPETSATMMASDFLLQELDRYVAGEVTLDSGISGLSGEMESSPYVQQDTGPYFDDGDLRIQDGSESDVLFGGGGIM